MKIFEDVLKATIRHNEQYTINVKILTEILSRIKNGENPNDFVKFNNATFKWESIPHIAIENVMLLTLKEPKKLRPYKNLDEAKVALDRIIKSVFHSYEWKVVGISNTNFCIQYVGGVSDNLLYTYSEISFSALSGGHYFFENNKEKVGVYE